MNILFLVGDVKDSYFDGNIDTTVTGQPAIWYTCLTEAKQNSPKHLFYIGAVKKSKERKIVILPLYGINGCLVVFHCPFIERKDMTIFGYCLDMIVEFFSYRKSNHPIDAVVVNYPPLVPMLRLYMDNADIPNHRPVIVTRLVDGIQEVKDSPHTVEIPDQLFVSGYLSADAIIHIYPHTYALARKICQKYLSFSEIREMDEKTYIRPHGVPKNDHELYFKRKKIAGWFGRITSENNTSTALDILDSAYKIGILDAVVMTSSKKSDSGNSLLDKYPYVKFSTNNISYLDIAENCRCSIFMPIRTAMPLTAIECLSRGCIPIIPAKYKYAEDFPSPFGDLYPFKFANKEEALYIIKEIMTNDEYYEEWAERLSKFVLDVYDMERCSLQFIDTVEVTKKKQILSQIDRMSILDVNAKFRVFEIAGRVLTHMKNIFYFEDFVKNCIDAGFVFNGFGGRTMFTTYSLYQYVEKYGIQTTFEDKKMVITRFFDQDITGS
jgi:glycosyltransferase involved in cell wall biosynthesis